MSPPVTSADRSVAPTDSAWRRRRIWLVPALLCVVAGIHMIRHFTLNQSSWGAGCGFGMFATVDHHGSRFIRCQLEAGQRQFAADPGDLFAYQQLKARVLPTRPPLLELARNLACHDWLLVTAAAPGPPRIAVPVNSTPQPDRPEATPLTRLRLELCGIRLDPHSGQLQRFVLERCTVAAPPGAVLVMPFDPAGTGHGPPAAERPQRVAHGKAGGR